MCLRNNILFAVLAIFAVTKWSGCRVSNNKVVPISIYTLPTSKFQAKDVIDSVVRQNNSFIFQKDPNYIDTFILDRSFCLIHVDNTDSVKYFYYFSGDVKEWFTNLDTTLLILSHLSVNGDTYDSKSIKKLPKDKIRNILNYFNANIIEQANKSLFGLSKYDIRLIDTLKSGRIEGKGVVCRQQRQCDTLFLKYIDGGKYTGVVIGGSGIN